MKWLPACPGTASVISMVRVPRPWPNRASTQPMPQEWLSRTDRRAAGRSRRTGVTVLWWALREAPRRPHTISPSCAIRVWIPRPGFPSHELLSYKYNRAVNRRLLATLVSLIAVAALTSAACQSRSQPSGRTAGPSPSMPTREATVPSPPQAPSPTPGPVVKTNGSLVFLRGKDLWVAALDGSTQRALTSGSLGAGYAGYTRSADGNVTLY